MQLVVPIFSIIIPSVSFLRSVARACFRLFLHVSLTFLHRSAALLTCDTVLGTLKHQLTPEREPTVEQSVDTALAQLGKPLSFTVAPCRKMGKGLVTGVEMTRDS